MRHADTYQLEYVTGLAEFERLALDPAFLAFVGLLDDEGTQGIPDTVSISTSDPEDAALAAHWLRRLSGSRVGYMLDVETGDDVVELVRFWSRRLDIGHERLRLRRRRFTDFRPTVFADEPHGVVTVRSVDPVLRIRLQSWIDKVRANLARAYD